MTGVWSIADRRRATTTKNMVKMHTATLLTGPVEPNAPGGMWLRYRADADLTKILLPAAALIAISHIWQDVPEGRGMMFSLLKNINAYHETPEQITNHDVLAMNAAMEVLLSGGKRTVAEFHSPARGADRQAGFPDPLGWTERRLAGAIQSVFDWFRRR